MASQLFILDRAVHFGACLLFFGFYAFDVCIANPALEKGGPQLAVFWRAQIRSLGFILLPLIFLSGIFWFVLVAMNMSGEPPQMEVLKVVWTQTQFGTVWKWRLIILIAAIFVFALCNLAALLKRARQFLIWLQLLLAGSLLASLALAGHGQETSDWHLCADVFHLLAAGFWPAGLLPLFLLLRKLWKKSESVGLAVVLVNRFSMCSLVAVALLSVSGLVNSWFLVGSFSNLFSQPYSRWLLAKIVVFILAAAIGAMNFLQLKPRLARAENFTGSLAHLRRNILIELILATVVIIIVAVLGILPPAIG